MPTSRAEKPALEIRISEVDEGNRRPKPPNEDQLGFSAFSPCVYVANELYYAGVDPNETRFKRVRCFDVGVRCGGWGNIVMELKVEDRRKQVG